MNRLKQTKRRDDRRLLDVLRRHWYLVVAFHEVNDRKVTAAVEFGGQIQDGQERIPVMFRGQIQPTIVAARPPRSVGFRNHVEGRRPR
jgi:hypothetical protein